MSAAPDIQDASLRFSKLTARLNCPVVKACRSMNQKSVATMEKDNIVYYLAYGSNLAKKTFLGSRGIRPLSQMNVCVPSLKLTFDLPGFPYNEPCFANTALRDPVTGEPVNPNPPSTRNAVDMEKESLLQGEHPPGPPPYHKDAWHKPLVGVLYGLTPKDFAHVIATEGGGASYHDVVVECFPLVPGLDTVPSHPSGESVPGHTLLAPRDKRQENDDSQHVQRGVRRPDPGYAQPSARYLKLITDGATEHNLPMEYRSYLANIRAYQITTHKQQIGRLIFSLIWAPLLLMALKLGPLFTDKRGRSPPWLRKLISFIFTAVWASYDNIFRDMFGDGERTQYKDS